MAPTKIFMSTQCDTIEPTQSICVPQSPAIIAFIILAIIAVVVLLVVLRVILQKRFWRTEKHHTTNAEDIELQTPARTRPRCEAASPSIIQWDNPDPFRTTRNGRGGGRGLAHTNSVKTIDTLPSYHERIEDDSKAMSPVSPRTLFVPYH